MLSRRLIVLESFRLGAARALAAATTFATIILFVRSSTPESFASFTILLTVSQSVAVLVGAWNGIAVQRDSLNLLTGRVRREFELGLVVALAAVAMVFAEAVRAFGAATGLLESGGFGAGVLAAAIVLHSNGMAHSLARHRGGLASVSELFRAIGLALAAFLVLRSGPVTTESMVIAVGSGYATSGMVALLASHASRNGDCIPRGGLPELVRGRLAYGLPMTVWGAVPPALFSFERVVVLAVAGPAAAAVYGAVQELGNRGAYALISPVISVVHPRLMAKADASGAAPPNSIFGMAVAAVGAVGVVVALGARVGLHWWPGLFGSVDLASASVSVVVGLVFSGFIWQGILFAHKPLEIARKPVRMLALLVGSAFVGESIWFLGIREAGVSLGAFLAASTPLLYSTICLSRARANSDTGWGGASGQAIAGSKGVDE